MTEYQARQQFTTAQVKLEKAFAEFNQSKDELEAITGQSASVNAQLTNAFSQAAGGAGKSLQADF